jgi:hypothetical protein
MSDIINLDPNADPHAREVVLNLLGATLSELRDIDRAVVGSSRNISALKTDLKNVFTQPGPQSTTVAAGLNIQQPPPLTPVPIQVAAVNTTQQVETIQEDPNQLVFDFNKKITPDDVIDKLDRILDKLDSVISLIKKN